MTITRREHQTLNTLLEAIKNVLSVTKVAIDEKRVQKGLRLHQPTIADCTLEVDDEQFSELELRYFPLDWQWGDPPDFLGGRIFLNRLVVRDPLPTLVKPPFFGGTGIFTIEGNDEVKVKTGFRKSRFIDYRFKAPGRHKENKTLVEQMNADPALMEALKREFAIDHGRPLPNFRWDNRSLFPLGGFDIFDIDNEQEKIDDVNFWKVEDLETVTKVVNRIEVLRHLAFYLQEGKAPPPKTASAVRVGAVHSCPWCGVELPLKARFCSNCGRAVT